MPAQRKHKPLPPVKVGGVAIARYQLGDGRIQIIDRRADGRRWPRNFADAKSAREFCEQRARELHNGGTEAQAFTTADRASYAQATRDAGGLPVHVVTAEWSQAKAKINGSVHSFLEVIEAGIRALKQSVHTVPTIVEELAKSMAAQDLNARYRRGLESTAAAFAKTFPGNIAQIRAPEIERFLDELQVGSRRRDNVLREIRHIFNFARLRSYLPDSISEARKVKKVSKHRGEIGIFTVAEMRLLLEHVQRDWLPFLAIAGFSGVRTEEISLAKDAAKSKDPLRWEDFDWDDREINIRDITAKTGIPRSVPILDNLFAWLAPWRDARASGPVAPIGKRPDREFGRNSRLLRVINRELAKAPISGEGAQYMLGDIAGEQEVISALDWKHNGLRHSYCSYRMAITRNLHQVADEMGNSPAIVKRNYRRTLPARLGREWFSVAPSKPANIVSIAA